MNLTDVEEKFKYMYFKLRFLGSFQHNRRNVPWQAHGLHLCSLTEDRKCIFNICVFSWLSTKSGTEFMWLNELSLSESQCPQLLSAGVNINISLCLYRDNMVRTKWGMYGKVLWHSLTQSTLCQSTFSYFPHFYLENKGELRDSSVRGPEVLTWNSRHLWQLYSKVPRTD